MDERGILDVKVNGQTFLGTKGNVLNQFRNGIELLYNGQGGLFGPFRQERLKSRDHITDFRGIALGILLVGLNGRTYGLPGSLWGTVIQMAERNLRKDFAAKPRFSLSDCEAIAGVLREEAGRLPPPPTNSKEGVEALQDQSFYLELADFLHASGGVHEYD